MGNKIEREIYYSKILEKSLKRHKKVPIIGTPKIEKKIDWEKLQNHFKKLTNGNLQQRH